MVLVTSQKIINAFFNDEFIPVIVYGAYGYGKTVYAIKVLAEVMGYNYHRGKTDKIRYQPNYDLNMLKRHIYFRPDNVVDRLLSIKKKEKVIVWDDAGFWLNALSWNDPRAIAIQKYLNVVRTDLASIIFTSPLPTWVTKKVRSMPQTVNIKIIKRRPMTENRDTRIGKAYRGWIAPDMKHTGVHHYYTDEFICKLPNKVYGWYYPIRQTYATEAKLMMKEELLKRQEEKTDTEAITEILTTN